MSRRRRGLRRRRCCCGRGRGGCCSCFCLPLCFELLVDGGLPAVLRLHELGVDNLLLLPKLARSVRLLLARASRSRTSPDSAAWERRKARTASSSCALTRSSTLTWRAASAAPELSRNRTPSELPLRLYAATARSPRDLFELGHSLTLLVDVGLQLGDASLELPGLLERIEVRTGDLIRLRLGFRDGLVRLGNGVGLLRGRRRGRRHEQHCQQATSNHDSDKARVVRVATGTHGSHLPSLTRSPPRPRPRCVQPKSERPTLPSASTDDADPSCERSSAAERSA